VPEKAGMILVSKGTFRNNNGVEQHGFGLCFIFQPPILLRG